MAKRYALIFMTAILFTIQVRAADPGVTEKEVIIGAHSLESGPFAMFGGISTAMSAYFDMINEKGGVDGRKIKYIRIDSHGDFGKATAATHKLVEQDKVFAIVGSVGNYHQAVYKYLIEKKIPDTFTNDGASFYTEPPNKYVIPGSYSFLEEGSFLGDHLTAHYKGKKTCFLLSASVQGQELSKAITAKIEAFNKTASAKDKMSIGPTETVDRVAAQADVEVSRMKKENCDVVVSSTTGTLAATMINYGFRQNYKPLWVSYRFNANDKFISLLDEGARDGVIATTPVATGENSGVAGWAEYKKLMEKNKIVISGMTTYGYYMAELFVEALRRAAKDGHELTREKYLKAVESFKDWTCSVCMSPVNISATNHWPLKPTLIVTKNGQWTTVK